jgi:hypothetical protein
MPIAASIMLIVTIFAAFLITLCRLAAQAGRNPS